MTAPGLVLPDDLLESPELATLAVLDAALQQALYALFAVHPELTTSETLDTCWSSGPDLWAADAIYNQIVALQHAIASYRQALTAQRARSRALDSTF